MYISLNEEQKNLLNIQMDMLLKKSKEEIKSYELNDKIDINEINIETLKTIELAEQIKELLKKEYNSVNQNPQIVKDVEFVIENEQITETLTEQEMELAVNKILNFDYSEYNELILDVITEIITNRCFINE